MIQIINSKDYYAFSHRLAGKYLSEEILQQAVGEITWRLLAKRRQK